MKQFELIKKFLVLASLIFLGLTQGQAQQDTIKFTYADPISDFFSFSLKASHPSLDTAKFIIEWGDGSSDTNWMLNTSAYQNYSHTYQTSHDQTNILVRTIDASTLRYLDISSSSISALSITGAPNLSRLDCSQNKILFLDLRFSKKLVNLNCSSNRLSSLILDSCKNLQFLDCSNNIIAKLSLGNCALLSSLDCSFNRINSLNFDKNKKLNDISCENNRLSEIDIDSCLILNSLDASSNNIKTVDLQSPLLSYLNLDDNLIPSIELSGCPELFTLTLEANLLDSLKLNPCKKLNLLNLSENPLHTLTIDSCTQLKSFYIYKTQLNKISIPGGLAFFSNGESAFKLSTLYNLGLELEKSPNANTGGVNMGMQTYNDSVNVDQSYDLSQELSLGGFNSNIQILDQDSLVTTDYKLESGKLSFDSPGSYIINLNNDDAFNALGLNYSLFTNQAILSQGLASVSIKLEVKAGFKNAQLNSLIIADAPLNQTFDPDSLVYSARVSAEITQTLITAIAQSPSAKVKGDGIVDLLYGKNSFPIEVTAEDGITKLVYTLNIYRYHASDASLESLSISDANFTPLAFTPVFSPTTLVYQLMLKDSTRGIYINGIATEDSAKVLGNGYQIVLKSNNNFIVQVIAPDKTTSLKYSIIINLIASNEKENQGPMINIYPNPSKGIFNIDDKTNKQVKIKVFSSNGSLLFSTQNKQIDLSMYSKGIYFIELNKIRYKVIKN